MDDPREVLIPMPFFWPYGGSSVFLCGSFNRWSELVAMTPVEGFPTVFQAICSIPPGHHQYKFFVDGDWRHDEHRPYAASEYGIVNTILATAEPNVKPNSPTPQLPTIRTMDLDNEVHRGDQPLPDAASRIPDADLAVSRHRVSAFLATHTAYELLPESGKVIALDIELPVKQAFHILYEQGIPTAPLWDFRRGQFVGVISVVDFILILRELGNRGSSLTEEELETHSIAAWKEGKAYLNRQLDGHGRALLRPLVHFAGIVAEEGLGTLTQRVDAISRYQRLFYVLRTPWSKNTVDEPYRKLEVYLGRVQVLFARVLYLALSPSYIDEIPTKQNLESEKFLFRLPLVCRTAHDSNLAGPYDSLKEICLRILQNNVATIPILHSASEDSSFPQLLLMASLSGILKCLCRYFRYCSSSLPVLQLPIYAIPIGTWVPKIGKSNQQSLAMLRPSDSLSSALNLLIEAQVSSLPIVDNNDSLLDIYSRSDITALAKDKAYTHMNLNEVTIHQALALGQDSYSPYEPRNQRCQMCLPSDSLHKVMERLANPGTRRLIIVEAGSKRVEGIVTLGDVFKFLLG